jgi:hypothetical protein
MVARCVTRCGGRVFLQDFQIGFSFGAGREKGQEPETLAYSLLHDALGCTPMPSSAAKDEAADSPRNFLPTVPYSRRRSFGAMVVVKKKPPSKLKRTVKATQGKRTVKET